MRDPVRMPSLDFLLDASNNSLHDLELAALNRSSNLGKAAREEILAWIEQEAVAMLARWMIENRKDLLKAASLEGKPGFEELFRAENRKKSA